jgi:hypothetical protein
MIATRRLFFVLLLGLAMPTTAAPAANFTGHYELAKSTAKAFALDVTQKDGKAEVSFSAGNEDGSGAAPDGDGAGRLNAQGELTFTFTDSFGNTGSAVLRRAGTGYRLSMKMDKVEEPRALVHYGILTLKRTSTKPQPIER